ncbi:hypothetical protein HW130_05590 [Streptomyces sp. PKU-EA00015]|uniref:hypothetical protein n=1 Tax=Streptomyces sp. PKU-EA00015 TaxID=2748326 RepID=UPI0015A2249F|nr:hypothetical protein [Streptomyces sp. PKU-EA00015]NWF25742.1 hypothetical protein [Streptomyces sp. PKU-EA00015]
MTTNAPGLAPLTDSATAELWASEVLVARGLWRRRHPRLPYYSLGSAVFLDSAGADGTPYRHELPAGNAFLMRRFASLYELLFSRLAELLGSPTVPAEGLALPGFQIMEPHADFTRPVAAMHYDLQYRKLRWWHGTVDRSCEQASFTVPLLVPTGGAGIVFWLHSTGPAGDHRLHALRREAIPYTPGAMLLHSGHELHQIAPLHPSSLLDPDRPRITLQGHALKIDDVWQCYW